MEQIELNEDKLYRGLLVSIDTGEFDAEISMEELKELSKTAGVEVILTAIQKRPAIDSATCVGHGFLQKLKEEVENQNITIVIFDLELTANQTKNIEDVLDVQVIDRTTLILDIFAQRAFTKEGRIQVELAQNQYRLAHLAGKGVQLSRLGGGIGTRGPGESKLETDKRHIRTRIDLLKRELKKTEIRRMQHRERRKKDRILTVAIVGYTNAGKSTLLNQLTDAGVLAENKLFATLDPTSRMLELPDGRNVMLVDTVGFIRRLPHQLVEAFKSTLEEAASADLILNVVDISADDYAEMTQVTQDLLHTLGCDDIPKIFALNKSDLVEDIENMPLDAQTVCISAKNNLNLDKLLECIALNLPKTAQQGKFLIPYTQTNLLYRICQEGKIFSEEYLPEGTKIDAIVEETIYYLVEEYKIEE